VIVHRKISTRTRTRWVVERFFIDSAISRTRMKRQWKVPVQPIKASKANIVLRHFDGLKREDKKKERNEGMRRAWRNSNPLSNNLQSFHVVATFFLFLMTPFRVCDLRKERKSTVTEHGVARPSHPFGSSLPSRLIPPQPCLSLAHLTLLGLPCLVAHSRSITLID